MRTIDINTTLVEGYLQLLKNVSVNSKLDLISKLILSAKVDIAERKKSFYKAFGNWESKASADEIIDEIRKSRSFNRKTEVF